MLPSSIGGRTTNPNPKPEPKPKPRPKPKPKPNPTPDPNPSPNRDPSPSPNRDRRAHQPKEPLPRLQQARTTYYGCTTYQNHTTYYFCTTYYILGYSPYYCALLTMATLATYYGDTTY